MIIIRYGKIYNLLFYLYNKKKYLNLKNMI